MLTQEILLEERTLLNEHEGTVIKKRTTKRAQDAAADAKPEDTDEVAELMSQLHTERQAFRDRRVEEQCTRPLKALLISLGEVAHSGRSHEEVTIAQEAARMIRRFITAQTEMISKLNKELDLFRATYNKRVVYFAALQEISDSVAAPLFRDLHIEIEQTSGEILEMETILGRMAVRARYLKFLGSSEDHEREDCTICFGTSDDKFAVLLDCGHAFCVSCFREYRRSPYIGSRCATCKTKIPDKKLTRIRIKKEEPTGVIEDAVQEPEPEAAEEEEDEEEALKADEAEQERRLQDLRQLNYLPEGQLQLITGMDMMGDYGSKINVLIKHLKLYRIQQPDVRHVVFSNWADSLHSECLSCSMLILSRRTSSARQPHPLCLSGCQQQEERCCLPVPLGSNDSRLPPARRTGECRTHSDIVRSSAPTRTSPATQFRATSHRPR